MSIRGIALVAVALLTLPAPLLAAEPPLGFGVAGFAEPLESDRPDFTEGTRSIAPGHLQLEIGYTYTRDSVGDSREHTLPEALLRAGLSQDIELRLGVPGYVRAGADGVTEEGLADSSVGLKVRLFEGPVPVSIISALTLPIGSSELSADGVEPEAKLCWAYDLAPTIGIAGNLNIAWPDPGERFLEPSASLTIGTDLTEELGGYLEYFGFYPVDTDSEDETHYLNGGVTLALSDNMQLDARVGAGLNDDAADLFSGVGFVVRR